VGKSAAKAKAGGKLRKATAASPARKKQAGPAPLIEQVQCDIGNHGALRVLNELSLVSETPPRGTPPGGSTFPPSKLTIDESERAQRHLQQHDAIAAARDRTILSMPGAFGGREGRELLAHELAHVIQQQSPELPGTSQASAETEADTFARAVTTGLPATVGYSRPRNWAYKKNRRPTIPSDDMIVEVHVWARRCDLIVERPDGERYTLNYETRVKKKHQKILVPRTQPYDIVHGVIYRTDLPKSTVVVPLIPRKGELAIGPNWPAKSKLYIHTYKRGGATGSGGKGQGGTGKGTQKGSGEGAKGTQGGTGEKTGDKEGDEKTGGGTSSEPQVSTDELPPQDSTATPPGVPVVKIETMEQLEELKKKGLLPVDTAKTIKEKLEKDEPLSFEEAIELIDALNKFVSGRSTTDPREEGPSGKSWAEWGRFLKENEDKISDKVKSGDGDLTVEDVEEILAKHKEFVGISEGKAKSAKESVEEWRKDPELRKQWNKLDRWEKELWKDYSEKYGETSNPDPESMDFKVTRSVRISMALRMSTRYMPEAIRETAAAIINDPMFQVSMVVGISLYLAMWVAPEPVITKAAAVLTTIALLSTGWFVGSELYAFASSWMALEKAAGSARSLEELEVAAEVFGRSFGAQQARILLALAMHFAGKALPAPKIKTTAPSGNPKLIDVPENLQGMKGAKIAEKMGLKPAPKGYHWRRTPSGKLTVARGNKSLDKLRYDPAKKDFVKEVPTPKRAVVEPSKTVPKEVEKMASQAMKARDAVGDVGVKTGAKAADGTSKLSGWGKDIKSIDPVRKLSEKIGHKPKVHGNDAKGHKGSYNLSHAEKQVAASSKSNVIGVSRVMCADCQMFFLKLARYRGTRIVVADPNGIRIFLPSGATLAAKTASRLAIAVMELVDTETAEE
jgi:hypothetical protein